MAEPAAPPEGTYELGIDIIRVRRIRHALERFGSRFTGRVLTPQEAAYVRDRPERLAGRWAAKEAVSKVLGLGVRGIGWREIEIVRLPTGQPAVSLSGRALRRAEQLGMRRIAVSITHEDEYAVAIACAVRTAGGAFVFPVDLEARLSERERWLAERLTRLRGAERERLALEVRAGEAAVATEAGGDAAGGEVASGGRGEEAGRGGEEAG